MYSMAIGTDNTASDVTGQISFGLETDYSLCIDCDCIHVVLKPEGHVCRTTVPSGRFCLVRRVQELERQVQDISEKFEALHDILNEIKEQEQQY